MKISLIAAKTKNNVIGKNGKMLWNLPSDLRYFQKKTMAHYILLGRKTYISLPNMLSGRKIIVVSRTQKKIEIENVDVVTSIIQGINLAKNAGEPELFIVGGDNIFQQTISWADKLYITEINTELSGDAFFPEIDPSIWKLQKKSKYFFENGLNFRFLEYNRKNESRSRINIDA